MNFLKHKTSKSKIFVTSITLTRHLSCLFLPCAVLNDTNYKIVFEIFTINIESSCHINYIHIVFFVCFYLCYPVCERQYNDTNNKIVFEISPMNFEPKHITLFYEFLINKTFNREHRLAPVWPS